MSRSLRIFSCAAVLALLFSCYSYVPVRVYKTKPGEKKTVRPQKKSEETEDDLLFEFSNPAPARAARIPGERRLAVISGSSAAALINNRAVTLIAEGKLTEAEILLRELLKEPPEGAVCNNLGVLCEILDRTREAASFYERACVLSPSNEHFRKNLSSLLGKNGAAENKQAKP